MIGLVFAFLLLATVLGYIIIGTKLNPIVKVLLIIVTTWYSIVLYSTPEFLAGRPKMVSDLPDGAVVLAAKIKEPMGKDPGGMYFWVIEPQEIDEVGKLNLNPFETFREIIRITPRAYGLEYNKEMHKKFARAKKQQKKQGAGSMMRYGKDKDRTKGQGGNQKTPSKNKSRFTVINPVQLLPPKD